MNRGNQERIGPEDTKVLSRNVGIVVHGPAEASYTCWCDEVGKSFSVNRSVRHPNALGSKLLGLCSITHAALSHRQDPMFMRRFRL